MRISPCSLFFWCVPDHMITNKTVITGGERRRGKRAKSNKTEIDKDYRDLPDSEKEEGWKAREKDEADRWRELKQANSLDSPGKGLFIPHISRDEGEQMFPGPQVT